MPTDRIPSSPEMAPNRRPLLGPRPLPLHLTMAATTWGNSRAALPQLKSGLLPLSPGLADTAAALRANLATVPVEEIEAAVDHAAQARLYALVSGILAYRRHPYRRNLAEPPTVWSEGNTRLLRYGGGNSGPPVLVVPSLVNRGYILDLTEKRSLMRYLAALGLDTFLVDWGAPTSAEDGFGLSEYIAGRLGAALDTVLERAGGPVMVIGYCMGGMLALALALRRQDDVAGLALMATPWDFHAGDLAQAKAAAALAGALLPAFDRLGQMPVDMLQAMFTALDPFLSIRKFVSFARLDPGTEKAEEFVALEDWVNDGVPLTPKVARECLLDWYGANLPARGKWRVAGEPVVPADLRCPALVLIPEQDRIVPPASAQALADALPQARRLTPRSGHIGMVISRGARERVWTPLSDWVFEQMRA